MSPQLLDVCLIIHRKAQVNLYPAIIIFGWPNSLKCLSWEPRHESPARGNREDNVVDQEASMCLDISVSLSVGADNINLDFQPKSFEKPSKDLKRISSAQ